MLLCVSSMHFMPRIKVHVWLKVTLREVVFRSVLSSILPFLLVRVWFLSYMFTTYAEVDPKMCVDVCVDRYSYMELR